MFHTSRLTNNVIMFISYLYKTCYIDICFHWRRLNLFCLLFFTDYISTITNSFLSLYKNIKFLSRQSESNRLKLLYEGCSFSNKWRNIWAVRQNRTVILALARPYNNRYTITAVIEYKRLKLSQLYIPYVGNLHVGKLLYFIFVWWVGFEPTCSTFQV